MELELEIEEAKSLLAFLQDSLVAGTLPGSHWVANTLVKLSFAISEEEEDEK
ncbi:hypothetical protein LCGC14_2019570 [marine sediment metagenome]|uniref:Uncharacterized protein n=1 Tax=marine sediment metagenome TaxID=412755 RepID=A0A0F9HB76_9ZZZZ